MTLSVGSRLGHYDVTALIGEGGMGEVYQATDTKLIGDIAPKNLREQRPVGVKRGIWSTRRRTDGLCRVLVVAADPGLAGRGTTLTTGG